MPVHQNCHCCPSHLSSLPILVDGRRGLSERCGGPGQVRRGKCNVHEERIFLPLTSLWRMEKCEEGPRKITHVSAGTLMFIQQPERLLSFWILFIACFPSEHGRDGVGWARIDFLHSIYSSGIENWILQCLQALGQRGCWKCLRCRKHHGVTENSTDNRGMRHGAASWKLAGRHGETSQGATNTQGHC